MTSKTKTLAVVIPAWRAASSIAAVVSSIPAIVSMIIIVNDASPDDLVNVVKGLPDPRVILLSHEVNQGVGGAMVSGFRKAMELGADYVARIDADGQMDPQHLGIFIAVAEEYGCDYVKACRFGHIDSPTEMPHLRSFGNIALTFLTKFVSGYWNIFDPQNGYAMISRRMLLRLPLEYLDKNHFYENSMLISLNIMRAKIGEIYVPDISTGEVSSARLPIISWSFLRKLVSGFIFRIYQKYVLRSLSPYALFLAIGSIFIAWSATWEGIALVHSSFGGVISVTDTVMFALLPFLMGWSLILEAIVLDVRDSDPSMLFNHGEELNFPRRK
ncbi:MAG: glycosyltransferase family 2 protein [Candidatus Riflebacteria bacterium]|nr:glycosyltransferase family 2 protein [Candidatus Riflebacteria bacterium]